MCFHVLIDQNFKLIQKITFWTLWRPFKNQRKSDKNGKFLNKSIWKNGTIFLPKRYFSSTFSTVKTLSLYFWTRSKTKKFKNQSETAQLYPNNCGVTLTSSKLSYKFQIIVTSKSVNCLKFQFLSSLNFYFSLCQKHIHPKASPWSTS